LAEGQAYGHSWRLQSVDQTLLEGSMMLTDQKGDYSLAALEAGSTSQGVIRRRGFESVDYSTIETLLLKPGTSTRTTLALVPLDHLVRTI
jgi:hypothetical protein